MQRLLGPEYPEFEASLDRPATSGLRVNTLKLPVADFIGEWPLPLDPLPWCPSGFVVGQRQRPGLHPFHAAGLYYLQDPAAMAVAETLAPRAGELVLDLAAAPGGKSTHLASLLGERGTLVANDAHGGRARELSRNLERWGSRRVVVTSASVAELAEAWPRRFDAVLLDAPCSGEGMFRKAPQALREWRPESVPSCAARQDILLAQAAGLVKPGGRLAYSTCTFGPEENEAVVERFLETYPDWKVVRPALSGVDPGRPDWSPRNRVDLLRTVRLWPHRQVGEGHFVALLGRSGDGERPDVGSAPDRERGTNGGRRRSQVRRKGRAAPDAAIRQSIDSWHGFCEESLVGDPVPEHRLSLQSDGLYALPDSSPSTAGLAVLRPGLWLGSVERGRFVPSHALALALARNEAQRSVDFEPDDPELHSYLTGAEILDPGEDGWTIVTVRGHPLGWGRRAQGIVKNHYPKGLRRAPGNRG